MRSTTLLNDFDARQRSSICGSQFGCHNGSLTVVLKIIHEPSTDPTRKQDKAGDGKDSVHEFTQGLPLLGARVVVAAATRRAAAQVVC